VLLASVGCCQQPIFTTYGEATDRALGDIAVDLECAVFEIGRQSGEPRQRMANVDGRAALSTANRASLTQNIFMTVGNPTQRYGTAAGAAR